MSMCIILGGNRPPEYQDLNAASRVQVPTIPVVYSDLQRNAAEITGILFVLFTFSKIRELQHIKHEKLT